MSTHRSILRPLCLATLFLLLVTPAAGQHANRHDERALDVDPRLAEGQIAPVLSGLGDLTHPITTTNERAQLFFDQGLKLTYGFNHQEALRAFKEAARLDPDAAMAYWGWALVLGPNINLPMRDSVRQQAFQAIQSAVRLAEKVSAPERDYIQALATRYSGDPEPDRAALDQAYADAMRKLHRKYPDDNDAATLFGAALMNLSPWNYWTADGRPLENTEELLATLEGVIDRDPHHVGALHYYIHAVEPVDPARGIRAADLLRGQMPGVGHMMHMPSHIYMQVGRYRDSFDENVKAARADEGYITQCRAQGIYPLNYYPHNLHMLAWAGMMEGRKTATLETARAVASKVPADFHGNDWALYQTFLSMPLYTMVRFGLWEEILEEPEPPAGSDYWDGIWHFARGMAFTYTGNVKQARKELGTLRSMADSPALGEVMIGFTNGTKLLTIAAETLEGDLASSRGRHDEALLHLDRAVRLQDSLPYTEPPDWYYPARHNLGAALLDAGRPVEAEVVYWEDLRRYPDNGYSLYGLWQTLTAQGRDAEAAAIHQRFEAAWSDADTHLTSSRF